MRYTILKNIPPQTKGKSEIYCAVDCLNPSILLQCRVYKTDDELQKKWTDQIKTHIDPRHYLIPLHTETYKGKTMEYYEYPHSDMSKISWLSFNDWICLLFQALYAVYILYLDIGIMHNELIPENIVLVYQSEPRSIYKRRYFVDETTYLLPNL